MDVESRRHASARTAFKRNRSQVERLRARLKECCAIATRYEKTTSSFIGVICIATSYDRLKR